MAVPTIGGLARLKRVARFLKGEPRCVQNFYEQHHEGKHIDVYCDSDWARDVIDRKSVSSVFVFYGLHLLKSTVSTQGTTALSSGEAEFTAGVKGTSVALGMKSLGADLGMELFPRMHTDSSAAKGIFGRRGIGRIRHLHTPLLWVQEKRAKKEIEVHKTPGETNPADLGTKELSRGSIEKHLSTCGFQFQTGSHPLALTAQVPTPGEVREVGGLSGDGRDQVPRSGVTSAGRPRQVLSGAWGGRIGAPAGRGPHAPLRSETDGTVGRARLETGGLEEGCRDRPVPETCACP